MNRLSHFASTTWRRRLFASALGLVVAGFSVPANSASAQGLPPPVESSAPANDAVGPETSTRNYFNRRTMSLPIRIDESTRRQVQEIHLYMKEGRSAPWTLRERANGSATAFRFEAPRDGEYWFAMATVDRQGRQSPANLDQEPPGLIVVIDTLAPQVSIASLGETTDGQMIQVDFRDENPDLAKSRFFYQTGDRVFRTLDPVAGKANVYCIPSQAVLTGLVRVTASDLAGNSTSREAHLSQLGRDGDTGGAQASNVQSGGVQTGGVQTGGAQAGGAQAGGGSPSTPAVFPTDVASTAPATARKEVAPRTNPNETVITIDSQPAAAHANVARRLPSAPTISEHSNVQLAGQPRVAPGEGGGAQNLSPLPGGAPAFATRSPSNSGAAGSGVAPIPTQAPLPQSGSPGRRDGVAQRQIINKTRIFMNYQIEQTGASGVGKVEVWCTRDQSQSWQRLCEDADRKSPIEVNLPGEGVFGLTVVVTNGRGFGGSPPNPGDVPETWVEVDTTKPSAEISDIRNASDEASSVHIAWKTSDKNLSAEPVELFYARERSGPWLPIARGLRGVGSYRWNPAADVGSQAYVRLSVQDRAGNVSTSETLQPVLLDDLSRPKARITTISLNEPTSPANNRVQPASGTTIPQTSTPLSSSPTAPSPGSATPPPPALLPAPPSPRVAPPVSPPTTNSAGTNLSTANSSATGMVVDLPHLPPAVPQQAPMERPSAIPQGPALPSSATPPSNQGQTPPPAFDGQ